MKRLAAAFVLASALGGSTPNGAEAGPWPLGPGHLYAKLSYERLRSTSYSAPDGTVFAIPRYAKDDGGFFLAYGLGPGLTAFASGPLARSSDLSDMPDELMRQTGLGDLRLGVQAQLGHRGPWVFAVSGLVQAPTGDETRSGGLQATGSGAWEAEAGFSAGRSFAGGRLYGFAEKGLFA